MILWKITLIVDLNQTQYKHCKKENKLIFYSIPTFSYSVISRISVYKKV